MVAGLVREKKHIGREYEERDNLKRIENVRETRKRITLEGERLL